MTELIISLVVTVLIFLLCREIACWYFKFSEIVNELKEIRKAINDTSK